MLGSASSGVTAAAESLIPDTIDVGSIDQVALPPSVQEAMEENGMTPDDLQQEAEAIFASVVAVARSAVR